MYVSAEVGSLAVITSSNVGDETSVRERVTIFGSVFRASLNAKIRIIGL